MADDYDSPWKEAIERHFADFLLFFFPDAHASIDWSQPVVFLDQELRAVVRDAAFGTRFVDKLVRVRRGDGRPGWVYVHLEVQGQAQASFAERMFVYHYRLYDRYRLPIASLAVLADDRLTWRPDSFAYEAFGCQLGLRFPIAKLMDWSGGEDRLQDSSNPFAVVTLAHLATRATRADQQARYLAKRALLKQLYRRGRDRQQVLDLMLMVDWMMRLPKELEQRWRQDVMTSEEDMQMRYVSSFEREGIEKGLQQGLQQGMQQGEARILERLLARRFGDLPQWARERLVAATTDERAMWTDAVLSAGSLEDVFGDPPT